jgi:hypothetical protein
MITDLFQGHKCPCGNVSRKNQPLKFSRIRQVPVNSGTDWFCKCLQCGLIFRIQLEKSGVLDE